jgi:hypothetical protein
MGLAEGNIEGKRRNLLALLKEHGFRLMAEETGEDGERTEIYVKGSEQFFLGRDVTFALGDWKTTMKYKDADEIFTPGYFPYSDVQDQNAQDPIPQTTSPTAVEHCDISKCLQHYFGKIKKSAIGCISEISEFFYKRAA